jgi:hypothetical protein
MALNINFCCMKTEFLIKKGTSHPVFCEDFFVIEESEHWLMTAVFDGCSSGTDSHFASTLLAKLARKAFRYHAKNNNSADSLAKNIIQSLVYDLLKVMNDLIISKMELLSTIIIAIVDKDTNRAFVFVQGDGVIVCDGKTEIFDHDDKPDYLIYDIEKIATSDVFFLWWEMHTQKRDFDHFHDLSISTDGILTFEKYSYENSEPLDSPLAFLLIDYSPAKDAKLPRKYFKLIKKHKFQHYDDIAMIRITNYDKKN